MAEINKIALIKEIRGITDAPMLDCRKALEESNWDLDAAIDWLNKNKLEKAAKKSNRIAAEGIVRYAENSKFAVLYELNSETDFVVQNDKFQALSKHIEDVLLNNAFNDTHELAAIKDSEGKDLATLSNEATGVIGEKITLRRAIQFSKESNLVAGYTHNNNRIAVAVYGTGSNATALRNVGMHIAAMNPRFALLSDVPATEVEEIRSKYASDPMLEKKPEAIRGKIVEGQVSKELAEFVLEAQPFVMESGMTVKEYLLQQGVQLVGFSRMELAEGIEKVETDFAAEVAAQMAK